MPRQQYGRRYRTIPHPQNIELQHPFFSATKLCLDYASLGMILPILITTVAIVLFISSVIPFLMVANIWIEEGLYTLFDKVAAVWRLCLRDLKCGLGGWGEWGVMHACICMCMYILLYNEKNKVCPFRGIVLVKCVYVNMQGKGRVLFYALLFCFLGRHTLTYCNCQSKASSFYLMLLGYI